MPHFICGGFPKLGFLPFVRSLLEHRVEYFGAYQGYPRVTKNPLCGGASCLLKFGLCNAQPSVQTNSGQLNPKP